MHPALYAFVLALLLSGATAAVDQEDPLFDKLDADQDGFVARTEAVKDPALAERFEQLDVNKDDRLDKAEFEAINVQDKAPEPPPPSP